MASERDDGPPALEILDPSPASTPSLSPFASPDPKHYPLPATANASTATALGLSSSPPPPRNAAHYLRLTQRYSSYLITAFAAMHAANTSLLPLLHLPSAASIQDAVADSSTYLLLTRPYYQSWPVMEPLLVAAFAAHAVSGAALRVQKRRVRLKKAGASGDSTAAERRSVPWPRVSWTSALGYAAVVLVGAHAALNRYLPAVVEGGSGGVGLEYVGHGVAMLPRGVGEVGYAVLVGVVGSHAVWGWGKWVGLMPERVGGTWVERRGERQRWLRRKRRVWGVVGVTVAVVGLWMAGGVGVVARGGRVGGWVGRGYDELFRRIPVLGGMV